MYLLGGKKWAHKSIDKASNETINKAHAKYKQCELNENGKILESPRQVCNWFVFK